MTKKDETHALMTQAADLIESLDADVDNLKQGIKAYHRKLCESLGLPEISTHDAVMLKIHALMKGKK